MPSRGQLERHSVTDARPEAQVAAEGPKSFGKGVRNRHLANGWRTKN